MQIKDRKWLCSSASPFVVLTFYQFHSPHGVYIFDLLVNGDFKPCTLRLLGSGHEINDKYYKMIVLFVLNVITYFKNSDRFIDKRYWLHVGYQKSKLGTRTTTVLVLKSSTIIDKYMLSIHHMHYQSCKDKNLYVLDVYRTVLKKTRVLQ